MKNLHLITFTLMGIGAINWGLVAIFNFNLVAKLFPYWFPTWCDQLVYALIGLSAIYEFAIHKTICKRCGDTMTTNSK